jgi:hypothetical protein
MSKKRSAMAKTSPARLRRTVFCPLCGTSMKKAGARPKQHGRDSRGRLIPVTRVFYGCPSDKCRTVIWFNYREDGKRGDLSVRLEAQRKSGVSPRGLALTGSFDGIL